MKTNGMLRENDKSKHRSSGLSILKIPLDLRVMTAQSDEYGASMHPR